MLLGFSHFWKLVMFYFFLFFVFQKAEYRLYKSQLARFCNIIFLFLLKIGSVGPVDQQINLVMFVKFLLRYY